MANKILKFKKQNGRLKRKNKKIIGRGFTQIKKDFLFVFLFIFEL